MSSAGQNGQARVRDQPVLFDGLFGAHHVRVANDHQCRRLDAAHRAGGNVLEVAHTLNALVEEQLKVPGMGRRREIRVPQFLWHLSRLGVLEAGPECRIRAIVVEKAGGDDEFANQARVPDRHLQRDRASIAESKNICLLHVEVFEKSRCIIGGSFEAEGPVENIGNVAESLLLKSDDLAVAGEFRNQFAERSLNGIAAACMSTRGGQSAWAEP